MKKKNYLTLGAIAVVSVAALGGASAAYGLQTYAAGQGEGEGNGPHNGQIEDMDYQTFKERTDERCQVQDKITEENFDHFKEMHTLMREGKFEEANKIREELGLPEMMGEGHGPKGPSPEVKEAIENNDYNAFKEAVGDKPIAEKVTEENFSKFVEMHNLREEGKFEEAEAIADELGIEKPGKGFGMKGGMHGPRF